MTTLAPALMQLRAMRDQPGLSRRVSAHCDRLIEQLQTPVRVAVFGLPGSGKAAVVNALAQADVLRPGAQSAPALVRFGDTAEIELTHGDGRKERTPAEIPVELPGDALLAEIAVPLDALNAMTLLNVVAEPTARDMAGALAWAASRCDIAIWCTKDWQEAEQEIWHNGPDSLKNHALLVANAWPDTQQAAHPARYGLEQTLCAITLDEANGALTKSSSEMLMRRLSRMISEARTEDLDAAALFIAQHAQQQEPVAPSEPTPQPHSGDLKLVAGAEAGATPAPANKPAIKPANEPANEPSANVAGDEARAVLTRLFLHLRQTAADLLSDLKQGALAPDDADSLLTRLNDAFEALVDISEAEHVFAETWPELHGTLSDAYELVLLLRIEGTPAQAAEAAQLLGQVRQDVEYALAA